jgi:hypothetical protein
MLVLLIPATPPASKSLIDFRNGMPRRIGTVLTLEDITAIENTSLDIFIN